MRILKSSFVLLLFFLNFQIVLGKNVELTSFRILTDTIPNPKNEDVLIRKLPLGADRKAALPAETRAIFPVDTSVRMGKLENGMTYYLKNHKDTENSIEWRLIVKTGSLMEEDNQRGMAHFIEHMAFNGTVSFENNELVTFLASSGLDFGRDFGAFTGWEETIYFLKTNSKDQYLNETIFLILKDWMTGIDFDSMEVEKEKGVILAELLERNDVKGRIFENEMKAAFKDTRYSERFPVGNKEQLAAIKVSGLEKFYSEWYRPDQMAIIIAGDIDLDLTEDKILKFFSDLEKPATAIKRSYTTFPANKEPVTLVQTDKELTQTTIQVLFKHPQRPVREFFTYRQGIVAHLCNLMIEERFRLINQLSSTSLLMATSGYRGFASKLDVFGTSALVKDGHSKQGIEALLIENERLKKLGFSQAELEKARENFKKNIEESVKNQSNIHSSVHAERMAGHFLFGYALLSPEQELALSAQYLQHIKLKDVNKLVSQWMPANNALYFISGPEKAGADYPDLDFILKKVEKVRKMELDTFGIFRTKLSLPDKPIQQGNVRSVSHMENLGLEHITLENGIQLFLKPMQSEKDQIIMLGFSKGGSANFDEQDHWVLNFSEDIIYEMGVAKYDKFSLEDLFNEKDILLNVAINEYDHGFFGYTPTVSLEFLLQMVHLYLTEPRMDKTAFEAWVDRNSMLYLNVLNDSDYWFNQESQKIMYKDVSRLRYPLPEDFSSMDVNRLMVIYRQFFLNPGNFSFVFVGDFDKVELINLAENHFGSLPARTTLTLEKPYSPEFNRGSFTHKFERNGIEKAKVALNWAGYQEWNKEKDAAFRVLQNVLELNLRDLLREKMGEVYQVKVIGGFDTQNIPYYSLAIEFECASEKAEYLADIVSAVTEDYCEGLVEEHYLAAAKEILLKQRENELNRNIFWLRRIAEVVSGQRSDEDILMDDYKAILENIGKDQLKNAASHYFKSEHFSRIIMLPPPAK